jgi:hypothetical protein
MSSKKERLVAAVRRQLARVQLARERLEAARLFGTPRGQATAWNRYSDGVARLQQKLDRLRSLPPRQRREHRRPNRRRRDIC